MKIKQIILLFCSMLILGGCKKQYSCSCAITVSVYNEDPHGPGFYTYHYYNTLQPIKEKLTEKQAKDVCDKTEKSLKYSLSKQFGFLGSPSGSCVVK